MRVSVLSSKRVASKWPAACTPLYRRHSACAPQRLISLQPRLVSVAPRRSPAFRRQQTRSFSSDYSRVQSGLKALFGFRLKPVLRPCRTFQAPLRHLKVKSGFWLLDSGCASTIVDRIPDYPGPAFCSGQDKAINIYYYTCFFAETSCN